MSASTSDSKTSSSRKHVLVTLLFLIGAGALVALLSIGLDLNPKEVPSALVGKEAQNFRVRWLQGQEHVPAAAQESFTLADLRGKPVILNIWASWCYSCREEAIDFEKFWLQGKGADVQLVGIAIQDTAEAAREFAKAYGKTYPLGLDDDGKMAIDYGVTGVPETFLIDANGIIVHKVVGPVTTDRLNELVATHFR